MKRGDIVKYTPLGRGKEFEVIGMLLSVDTPMCNAWNDFTPVRKVSLTDFEGNKHQIELWSDEEIRIVSHESLRISDSGP